MATKSKSAASQGKSGQSFVSAPTKAPTSASGKGGFSGVMSTSAPQSKSGPVSKNQTAPRFAGSLGMGMLSGQKNLSASGKMSLPNAGVKLLASSNGGFTNKAYGGGKTTLEKSPFGYKSAQPYYNLAALRDNPVLNPSLTQIIAGDRGLNSYFGPSGLPSLEQKNAFGSRMGPTIEKGRMAANIFSPKQPSTMVAAKSSPPKIQPAAFTRPTYAAGNYFPPQAAPQRPTYAAGNYFPPPDTAAQAKRAAQAIGLFPQTFSKYHDQAYNSSMFGGPAVAGAETFGPDYDTGWKGPQSGPETMPDPAGSPPMQPGQKYNVADSFTGNTNPAQERQPIPGWAEKIPGGIGMAASGLNWMANLPGDGPDRRISSNVQDRLPETIWDGSKSSGQLAQAPQMATGAINPVAAAKTAPIGYSPQQYLYPQYTQGGWAPLPRGLYGFKA